MVFHFMFKLFSFFMRHVVHIGFWLKSAFYAFAVYLMIVKLFQIMFKTKDVLYPLLGFKTDLAARYGKNSWAVVTGASDGIGKAFVFELAKDGFNIVLVGRNREKLEGVEKELKSQYQSAQTRIVVEDNTNAPDQGFSQRLVEQVKDLDVSILINNAGIAVTDVYTDIPLSKIKDIVLVNALAPALITRAFLPQLAQRKKSALITVSSIAADKPKSRQHLYGATKAFVDYLSRGLKDEHSNIDFLSLKPAYVATKMTGKEVGGIVVAPEKCVRSTLRALGHADSTYGNWKHSIQGFINDSIPDIVRRKFL